MWALFSPRNIAPKFFFRWVALHFRVITYAKNAFATNEVKNADFSLKKVWILIFRVMRDGKNVRFA